MLSIAPVSREVASQLLDFGGSRSVTAAMAREQLDGAVAVHNIAVREGLAYLADEVGMGKTYVALGAIALMRFFHPQMIAQCAEKPGPTLDQMIDFVLAGLTLRRQPPSPA